ncbi:MAG: phosphoenolpyruvate carboxylase, partial [Bacteroidota bacterium]
MKTKIEQQGLQKIETDFKWMLERYRQVLLNLGEAKLVKHLFNAQGSLQPSIPDDQATTDKLTQALSIAFQLLNLVEENAAVQFRRRLEDQLGLESIRGSWAETFKRWQKAGVTEQQAKECLKEIKIMPVLTAHPTEAKRVSIIELHREFYLLLVKKENSTWSTK